MASRRIKSIIQQAIRSLKRDLFDGHRLGGVDIPYSRGKSFEYMIFVSAMDDEYTKFHVAIVEYGGKKRRARDRHMEEHWRKGDRTLRFEKINDGSGHSRLMPCCDNEPGIGKGRIIRGGNGGQREDHQDSE